MAIEKGDDEHVVQNSVSEIKESMEKIGSKKLLLYPYAHLSANLASPSTALAILKSLEENLEGIDVSHAPFGWTKSYQVKVKGHPLAESCLLYTSPSPRDLSTSRMPSSA